MFGWVKTLRAKGVLGINRRNIDFIQKHNRRKAFPLVDDKLQTKALAIEHDIAVPPLYGQISAEHEVASLIQQISTYEDFVIKPAHGAGGEGILVISGRFKNNYRKSSGLICTGDDVKYHLSNILSGVYSLGGLRDTAMLEYRVKFDPVFDAITYQGVPDIRIILLHGYPVMAMLRLPTRQSDGKANLHQGAMGVGIDISNGQTQNGVWFNDIIDAHPDTGASVAEVQVPHWDDCLLIAAKCYDMTGLGYLGVDIVMDKDMGPLMLELNARPGLNIQIANEKGLLHRCRLVESHLQSCTMDAHERVQFSKNNFKGE